MKKTKTIIASFCFLICSSIFLRAQQGSVVTGGDASGAGGSVSYSIGQTDYNIANGIGGSVSQGMQHPYEISVATGTNESVGSLTCNLYPNPTSDLVVLNVQNDDVQNMSYRLFDIQGKLIAQQQLNKKLTNIPMTGYSEGAYIINIIKSEKEIKTFKIIKTLK